MVKDCGETFEHTDEHARSSSQVVSKRGDSEPHPETPAPRSQLGSAQPNAIIKGSLDEKQGFLGQVSRRIRKNTLVRRIDHVLQNSAPVRRAHQTYLGRSRSERRLRGRISYDAWVHSYDTLSDEGRHHLRDRLALLRDEPLFSIVVPLHHGPLEFVRPCVDSILCQLYPNWELCIVNDGSADGEVRRVLDEYAVQDRRIRLTHLSEDDWKGNDSLLSLTRGGWICLLGPDDLYAEHALALLALQLASLPDAGVLYSDEDRIDEAGCRRDPYFKPDFDPLLLLGQDFLSHLLVVRRDLLERIGDLRVAHGSIQSWDLVLRVSEVIEPSHIIHVPHVLYHHRMLGESTGIEATADPRSIDTGRQAVERHLLRTHRSASISTTPFGHIRMHWPVPHPPPRVTIIVPTRDGRYFRRCVDSVLSLTNYPNFEIVVIDNGSKKNSTLVYLAAITKSEEVRVLRDPSPFNYSALNNRAVASTQGDVVCLLNDDVEATEGTWLTEMLGQLCQDGVGAVGAKLDYPNARVQHAGIVLGIGGIAGHPHKFADASSSGYNGRLDIAQYFSAVTGACMMVRREAWEQLGGLDEEHLKVAFNDVDFCMRLRESGWRVAWTPDAELIHHESATRGSEASRRDQSAAEIRYMHTRWSSQLASDPAYNPNLTLLATDWSPASPPRVSYDSVR